MKKFIGLIKPDLGKYLLVISTLFFSTNAFSKDAPKTDELAALIDALTSRVATLESITPSSSVEGRSYCLVIHSLAMIGIGSTIEHEQLQSTVFKRNATFTNGVYTATLSGSASRNVQDDFGIVTFSQFSPEPTINGTYTQAGGRLAMDIVAGNGDLISPTWHVSKDGSVIQGAETREVLLNPPNSVVTIGVTTTWTLIEGSCD